MFVSTAPTAKKRSGVAQMYVSPSSSVRIFCTMNVATVRERSVPISIVRRQRGMISVESRKLITVCTGRAQPQSALLLAEMLSFTDDMLKCPVILWRPRPARMLEKAAMYYSTRHDVGQTAHRGIVLLDQSSNHAQRCQAQVLERSGL
jgi:hypothetical protein